MKSDLVKPYIIQLTKSLVGMFIMPGILIANNALKITIIKKPDDPTVILSISIICFYIFMVIKYIIPGICSIFDIITDSFEDRKMTYVVSNIQLDKFFISKAKKDKGLINSKYFNFNLYQRHFMYVIFSDHKGKVTFTTTLYHIMEQNKRYTIKYGKFSKIIVSILSQDGEEMLVFE